MANEYFNKMNKARKEGAKSFTHNGKTYVSSFLNVYTIYIYKLGIIVPFLVL